VINHDPAFSKDFLQILVRHTISEIEKHGVENNFFWKLRTLNWNYRLNPALAGDFKLAGNGVGCGGNDGQNIGSGIGDRQPFPIC